MDAKKLMSTVEDLSDAGLTSVEVLAKTLQQHQALQKKKRRALLLVKRLGIIAMAILLICCFAIPGFADNARGQVIALFAGIKANRITTIPYDKTTPLTGCVAPTALPDGFQYRSIQRSASHELYNIIYTNDVGNVIVFYHYPAGMTGSYDNEYTDSYALGKITVARSGEQTTISFPHMDARIQMEFDTWVSDAEIRLVAESMKQL